MDRVHKMRLGTLFVWVCVGIVGVYADCYNYERDGQEAGVDCGGPDCYMRCQLGSACTDDLDCETSLCVNEVCIQNHVEPNSASGPLPEPYVPDDIEMPSTLMVFITSLGFMVACFGIMYIAKFGERAIISVYRPVDNTASEDESYAEYNTDIELADV